MSGSRRFGPHSRNVCLKRTLLASAIMAAGMGGLLLFLNMSDVRLARVMRARILGCELLSDDGVVFQSGRLDCGPAALAMAIERLGRDRPPDLVRRAREMRWGWTVDQLVEVSSNYGVEAQAQHVDASELKGLSSPSIVLWGPHFVVIEKVRDDEHLIILDPSTGRMLVPVSVIAKQFRGRAVVFRKSRTLHGNVVSMLGPSSLEPSATGPPTNVTFHRKE